MSTESEPATVPPTIHEAERASGASGAVLYGPAIEFATAVDRRRRGQDIVVRGANKNANRRLAQQIEAAVGPADRQDPHKRAGPLVLPHYQQEQPPPEGHAFYETEKRKARAQP
jgi:16S rRNA G1207 methylase RsmC